MQYYIEEHEYVNGEDNDWKSKHEFLFKHFVSVYLNDNIKLSRTDRKGGKYIRHDAFGENSDNVINILKKNIYVLTIKHVFLGINLCALLLKQPCNLFLLVFYSYIFIYLAISYYKRKINKMKKKSAKSNETCMNS